MKERQPRIFALTPGDPEGIGPEIAWKAVRANSGKLARKGIVILCVGAREPFERLGAPILEANPESPFPPKSLLRGEPKVWLLPAPERSRDFLPGFQSGWSIERAARLVMGGAADALVTGPISKDRLRRGGYRYSGHTDFLADLCGVKGEVTMMLANPKLRISLVTTHLALRQVPDAVTRGRIRRATLHTVDWLRRHWGIARPRIAIAALNPHAGERGLFGREEIEVISPEISHLRRKLRGQAVIDGPLPSDTLFAVQATAGLARAKRYDAVICMYHDQGLIAVKQLDFANTVNVTLGLPLVRTSVDHGVAFDIAGSGRADPSSLEAAIEMAARITGSKKPAREKGRRPQR